MDWLKLENPPEEMVPPGYELVPDNGAVRPGDVVLDYAFARGFSLMTEENRYSCILGLSGHEARLHDLVYEVFRPIK